MDLMDIMSLNGYPNRIHDCNWIEIIFLNKLLLGYEDLLAIKEQT